MTTKEILLRRKDIPDECVEELVARASALQEQAQTATDGHASEAEVTRVAEELDIAPEYVNQAIEQWRGETAAAATDETQVRIRSRGRTMMRWMLGGLVVTTAIGAALTFASVSIFGWKGLAGLGTAAAAIVAFVSWLLG